MAAVRVWLPLFAIALLSLCFGSDCPLFLNPFQVEAGRIKGAVWQGGHAGSLCVKIIPHAGSPCCHVIVPTGGRYYTPLYAPCALNQSPAPVPWSLPLLLHLGAGWPRPDCSRVLLTGPPCRSVRLGACGLIWVQGSRGYILFNASNYPGWPWRGKGHPTPVPWAVGSALQGVGASPGIPCGWRGSRQVSMPWLLLYWPL